MKASTEIALRELSRQAGRDIREVACEWYPEFRGTSSEWQHTVFDNIHDILATHGQPFTLENVRRAAIAFVVNAECDLAAAHEANPPKAPAFVPKSAEVEADFLKNCSTDEMKQYMQAKYANG